MKKKILLIPLALLLAISLVAIGWAAPSPALAPPVQAAAADSGWYNHWYEDQYHVAIIADMHLAEVPRPNRPFMEEVIQTFNSWTDVDMVATLGDNVYHGGTQGDQIAAKLFYSQLFAPFRVIVGNHDYLYDDAYTKNPATGHTLKQGPESRTLKLEFFKENWGLEELFYSERLGDYLLVFLSADGLETNNYAEMADRQLEWFSKELGRNKNVPTICFFHAPLEGTITPQDIEIGPDGNPFLDSDYAEPADKIREILLANEQVFMWVAGHLHMKTTNPDFKSDLNLYENQVWGIHCSNLNSGEVIYTNSLFLQPDRVIVRTYNHQEKRWLKEFERTIKIPLTVSVGSVG